MPKYLLKWDAGYGTETEVIECATHEEADDAAYERWREAVESSADWSAEPLTKELAADYGYYDELEEGESNG